MNLLLLYDDAEFMKFTIDTLRSKGVKIVDFPSLYEASSIVPFLLVNDHSIIVMKNPKKDVMNLLKLIVRKGFIFFKQQKQPIKINLTFWILLDMVLLNEKQKLTKKGLKSAQEMLVKEYGTDFPYLFDIILDFSVFSNVEALGYDF